LNRLDVVKNFFYYYAIQALNERVDLVKPFRETLLLKKGSVCQIEGSSRAELLKASRQFRFMADIPCLSGSLSLDGFQFRWYREQTRPNLLGRVFFLFDAN
jgi:hypothetical protein